MTNRRHHHTPIDIKTLFENAKVPPMDFFVNQHEMNIIVDALANWSDIMEENDYYTSNDVDNLFNKLNTVLQDLIKNKNEQKIKFTNMLYGKRY